VTVSLRGALRTSLVLLMGFIAGSRLISAWRWLQFYREWRGRDPSGADASLTFAEGDLAIAVLSMAGAWLAWWHFRPRGGAPPPGTVS
jgi:hypothetical protein